MTIFEQQNDDLKKIRNQIFHFIQNIFMKGRRNIFNSYGKTEE